MAETERNEHLCVCTRRGRAGQWRAGRTGALCECREWIGVGHTTEDVADIEGLGVDNRELGR